MSSREPCMAHTVSECSAAKQGSLSRREKSTQSIFFFFCVFIRFVFSFDLVSGLLFKPAVAVRLDRYREKKSTASLPIRKEPNPVGHDQPEVARKKYSAEMNAAKRIGYCLLFSRAKIGRNYNRVPTRVCAIQCRESGFHIRSH